MPLEFIAAARRAFRSGTDQKEPERSRRRRVAGMTMNLCQLVVTPQNRVLEGRLGTGFILPRPQILTTDLEDKDQPTDDKTLRFVGVPKNQSLGEAKRA
jgi:hypothetical protein